MATASTSRPFSTGSVISPHQVLAGLASQDGLDLDAFQSPTSSYHDEPGPSRVKSPSTVTSSQYTNGRRSPGHSPRASSSSRTPPGDHHARPDSGVELEDQFAGRMFVRARFDFKATDPSALSFRAGEIIEVITRLESGWWDGLMGSLRGWFPSNFVEEIDPRDIMDEFYDEDEEVNGQDVGEGREEDEPRRLSALRDIDGHGASGSQQGQTQGQDKLSSKMQGVGLDDILNKGGWDEDWGGSSGLDDLAREVMNQGGDEMDDDADEFAQAARDRRRRIDHVGLGITGDFEEQDDDGFSPRRTRHGEATGTTLRPDERTPSAGASSTMVSHDQDKGDMYAWIPSVTPDGQVYYHNELTGEDAWELPMKMTVDDESDESAPAEEEMFGRLNGHASSAYTSMTRLGSGEAKREPKSQGTSPLGNALHTPPAEDHHPPEESFRPPAKKKNGYHEDSFRPPPKTDDLPYPWAAKMSDDGREWLYVNRLTGQTRGQPPLNIDVDISGTTGQPGSANRASVVSIPPPKNRQFGPPRNSTEVHRRQVEEWAKRTRAAMRSSLPSPLTPTMGQLMDNVNDNLREIFEACVAGSAAEEEYSRAQDFGNQPGVAMALAREETAEEMLKVAHTATLASIRELFSSFGYVGPLDTAKDMPRPPWVGDMTLIGNIGLLSATVHAATTSHRSSDTDSSTWAEVTRAGTKLKDVIAVFPAKVTPGSSSAAQEAIQGKVTDAALEFKGMGEILSGRWGFGSLEDPSLRLLDESAAESIQHTTRDLDALPKDSEHLMDMLRHVSALRQQALSLDIASTIDIDGELPTGIEAGDAKAYTDLVNGAWTTLLALDAAIMKMTDLSFSLLSSSDVGNEAAQALGDHISAVDNAIVSLRRISLAQSSMVDRGLLRGQIGHRSARCAAQQSLSARPTSMRSDLSGQARQRLLQSRGLEEEFLDSEEALERRDQAGKLVSHSASASVSSLPRPGPRAGTGGNAPGEPVSATSAASSTTSLAYQQTESDSGSTRGKRASLLKFIRGRSFSDADEARNNRNRAGPSKKLAKILGEDVSTFGNPANLPPSLAPPVQIIPETPWYLKEDYDPQDIIFDDKGGVRAGTLKALVARLTPHGSTDTSFFQAFMLTFRSFTTSDELLDLLVERYHIRPPDGLDQEEMAEWTKQKQTPLQLRVCNTIRAWLDKYYIEEQDLTLLDRVDRFAEMQSRELAAQQLKSLVQRRRRGETETQRRTVSGGLLSPPAPLNPRVQPGKPLRVTDISPVELARQLTILEFSHFQRIKPVECLNKAWNRADGDVVAPNVRSVIKTANVLSGWVGTTCLSSRDAKQRAGIMKYFIQTAMELRNLNNFSSLAAVVAGLNTAPVLRLRRSWELCSPKTQALKAEVDKTLDSTKNFQNYKDMLKTINPPCVPFFGFWLSALTFIEDGNKDFISAGNMPTPKNPGQQGMPTSASSSSIASLARQAMVTPSNELASPVQTPGNPLVHSSNGTNGTPANPPKQLINFFKRSLSAEILRDIHQYQSQPYNLAKSKIVSEWLMSQLDYCDRTYDLETLYTRSLDLEPREKEGDQITRLLKDSGFM